MNKKKLSVILFAASALFAVLFAVLLCRDYFEAYQFGSAPFYLYAVTRAAEFLLPSAICLGAAVLVKRRKNVR